MQATVGNRTAAKGALLEHTIRRQAPQEVLILCLVTQKSMATSILNIATTETTFLPVKSTAESQYARTTNERNMVALQQVKCNRKLALVGIAAVSSSIFVGAEREELIK